MTSEDRHNARYYRRILARQQRKQSRADALGSLDFLFSFYNLFKYGLAACRNVRWKSSVQEFEMELFSKTATQRRLILKHQWTPDKYVHFLINERGKTRPIDAPRIQDRQVNKVFTKEILLPLYLSDMIYNNGASLDGKGYKFSQGQLTKDLRHHYNLYGRNGYIILIDFHHFFPNANHQIIYNRHQKLLLNKELCKLGDHIIKNSPKEIGLPLGIETSQIEMIAYPTPLDNFIKCQLSVKGMGHYMDDYYIIVSPEQNPNEILYKIQEKALELQLEINHSKTQIIPLTKRFRYCKTQWSITSTGKIYKHCNKTTLHRDIHKLYHFYDLYIHNKISIIDLYASVSAMQAYLYNYNDHYKILKFRSIFYQLFKFYPNSLNDFKENL